MSALLRLTLSETVLFLRDPANVIFGLGLSPLVFVVLGLIPSFREPAPGLGGPSVIALYTPIVIAMAVTMLATNMLPQLLAGYRQRGVLRRLRTTPVRPTTVIGAQLVMFTALSAATMLLILAVARLGFGVALPANPVAFLLSFALTAVAMLALGALVAAVAPTAMAASGIGLLLFFPLVFFAGMWMPRAAMSDVLRTISDLTPLGAGVASLQDAAAGGWPQPLHAAVMLGWAIVAGVLAARLFRWD